MDLHLGYAVSILEIALINMALSADNAVVIALAAHKLPGPERRRVVVWGGALAIAMQALFTAMIAHLLAVPGLPLVGAVLLLWIAGKLVQEEARADGEVGEHGAGTGASIGRIALANLVMSVDNVVAVASVCRSDPVRMALGLVISGLILFAFSAAIVELMARFRWIAYAGASVLAVTAAGMMYHELEAASGGLAMRATMVPAVGGPHGLYGQAVFTGLVVAACLGFPRWGLALTSGVGGRARASGGRAAAVFRRSVPRNSEQPAD